MVIITYEELDPFEEVNRMHRRMHRLMRRMVEPFREPWKEFKNEWNYESFPIDIKDSGNDLIVEANLPGFEKDEIKIHVTDNSIEISAKEKKEKKEVTKTMYRHERIIGEVKRRISLPAEVDSESAQAEFKNGVLRLKLKKKKIKKGKEVQIR